MFSQVYYLLRSQIDGSYVVAHPDVEGDRAKAGYLLMFREHFDALSYVNKHAADVVDRLAVESISGSQIKSLLNRWQFAGIGIVNDPLLPRVEFITLK